MILNYFKSQTKKIIQKLGYSINKNIITFDSIFRKNLNGKLIIFDVGANIGQSIKRFNDIFPESIIHSFEPIKECYEKMLINFPQDRFIKNNYALSEKNTNKKFFINKFSFTSSFTLINSNYEKHFYRERDKLKKTIVVKTITLDKYINLNKIKKIDILKIDTQGHELSVLKGGKSSLKKNIFNFIEVEIIINDYYTKKVNLHEIDRLMVENNFELFGLQGFSYSKKNQINYFDMLYKNKNIIL
jgi:FkbM family methyltransferase